MECRTKKYILGEELRAATSRHSIVNVIGHSMNEARVFKSFVFPGLREGENELCRNWKSQRIPLTESLCPKRTYIDIFPAESMVNDENLGKCTTKATHLMDINHWRYVPIIDHDRSFPALMNVIGLELLVRESTALCEV